MKPTPLNPSKCARLFFLFLLFSQSQYLFAQDNANQDLSQSKSDTLAQPTTPAPADSASTDIEKSNAKEIVVDDLKNEETNSPVADPSESATIPESRPIESDLVKNTENNSEFEVASEIEQEPLTAPASENDLRHERLELGWVERIRVYPEQLEFDAKLTPGSEGNVMHADHIAVFKKGKTKWIRFQTMDKKGKTINLERKVVSSSLFLTTNGKKERRYKVDIGFCIANKYFQLDFALSDRSDFEQQARIGRDALAGHFVVDPARTRTHKPKCIVKDLLPE